MKKQNKKIEDSDSMNFNAQHMQYNFSPDYTSGYMKDVKSRYSQDEFMMDNTINGVMINPKQLYWISKRKARREQLDGLMVFQKNNYMHESRHRHAMKRMRAASGRFLTKEEMNRMKKDHEKYSEKE